MLLHISSIHLKCGSYLSTMFSNPCWPPSLCSTSHFQGSSVISDTSSWVLHGLQWLVRLLNYNCWYPTSDSAHKSWSTVCAAFTVWQTSTSWPVSDKVSVGWTWTLIKQVYMGVLRIERENWMAEEYWCSIYVFHYKYMVTFKWTFRIKFNENSTTATEWLTSWWKVLCEVVCCMLYHLSVSYIIFLCVLEDKGNMRCWYSKRASINKGVS